MSPAACSMATCRIPVGTLFEAAAASPPSWPEASRAAGVPLCAGSSRILPATLRQGTALELLFPVARCRQRTPHREKSVLVVSPSVARRHDDESKTTAIANDRYCRNLIVFIETTVAVLPRLSRRCANDPKNRKELVPYRTISGLFPMFGEW
jgi:hypothetical protein